MPSGANVVVYAGLLIGLVYGAVGLLSGFCLMSSLRGWWAQGDSRLIRSYALALGVTIAAAQLLAAGGVVDLGKSIYLHPSFSGPPVFFCGLPFGRAGAARQQQSTLVCRGDRARHNSADDPERPDCAGTHRTAAVVADGADRDLAAGAADDVRLPRDICEDARGFGYER